MPTHSPFISPEQERIFHLFKNNNPKANLISITDPQLNTDTRGSNPSQDYRFQDTLVSENVKPSTSYQEVLRRRFQQISDLGTQQTDILRQGALRQQQTQARQSYGSGQYPAGNYEYGNDLRGRVLSAIAKYEGTPYSWGGGNAKGPTRGIAQGRNTVGFDCSGLVQYAYAQVGIKMPRLAEQQATMGRRVPINQLKQGDLVAGPGHIAVYAGNGMMWEAPRTGSVVRLVPVRKGLVGVALGF